MKNLARALPALLRAELATMMQYRGEIMLWALWGVIYPAVAMTMWSAAAPEGETIRGLGRRDFAAYFLITMVVGHLTAAWDLFEFGYLVRSGRLSPALLRPVLPMWGSLATNTAYKLLTLTILTPIWFIVAWIVRPEFHGDALHVAAGALAALLAAALNYLLGYTLALAAFWTTRTDAIGEFWFGASLIFGGRMAPLELLPVPMQWFAAILPMKWITWFPCSVLIGRLSADEIVVGLLWQVGWLTAAVVGFRVLWRAALRQYSAVGA